jgi:hypothetical protein
MTSTGEFGSLRHLAGRFFGALLPVGPRAEDERWARAHLLPGEQALWRRMSRPDRRHAVGVARRTVEEVDRDGGPAGAGRSVIAAALLHDVGKVEAGLGTWARAGVTLAAMATGRDRVVAWSESPPSAEGGGDAPPGLLPRLARPGTASWRRRVGLYLVHDRVGADLLQEAGSDRLTVAWAGEHHRPPERWTVDRQLGEALKLADDD